MPQRGTAVQHDRSQSDGRAPEPPGAEQHAELALDLTAARQRNSSASTCLETTTRRRRSLFTLFVALVALSPLGVGAYTLVRDAKTSGELFGDRAVIALTAADVWRTPVLLGPYSRFYWHHPGPVYFYVLGVWNWAFGGRSVGLTLGATGINLAAAVGVLAVAHRRGGRPLVAWTALLMAFYLLAIGPVAFDVWNPSVTLLPFAFALMLAWSFGVSTGGLPLGSCSAAPSQCRRTWASCRV